MSGSAASQRILPWLLLFPTAGGRATGDPIAEAFVETAIGRLLDVLGDQACTGQRRAAFRTAILTLTDTQRIAEFILDRHALVASPEQKQRFCLIFRTYLERQFLERLAQCGGARLNVTGSTRARPGEVVVDSLIDDGRSPCEVPVAWRLRQTADGWRVVDVQCRGVWLAATGRQAFLATVDGADGDIEALIARLQGDVAKHPTAWAAPASKPKAAHPPGTRSSGAARSRR